MLLGLSALIIITSLVWLALPTRICRVMDDCLGRAERLYHGAQISGLLSPSSDPEIAESLHHLQRTVSEIQERQLYNSLRPWCEIWDMLRGHSLGIFRCVRDIKVLKNQIEIRREIRLRELMEGVFTNGEDATRVRFKHLDMRHTRLPMCDC
ncbi:hypothetical protein B0H17DRAFT_1181213 [Mycena rosella]|uniref:Uncharacterized protein n=1 Tax=Mycena rosella TaxID=1033263 RepID=A0AAD7D9J0_MYCRO|nr:hypothetical protein B0H17DRAFT_1181213 [Mycena rosella]